MLATGSYPEVRDVSGLVRDDWMEGYLQGIVGHDMTELRKSTERYDVYHWRDRDADEVDIVLELGDGRVIGIEVKSATSFNAKQFKGLRKLRDQLGEKFVAGIVLNTAITGYRLADRLYGAPVSALWEFGIRQ